MLNSFNNYTLASVDLPGCGDSAWLNEFSYRLKDQADLVLNWINGLNPENIILVGHSMGGVVGIFLTESLGSRVKLFFNLEGNISAESCFFSGKITSLPQEVFERRGFHQFVRTLGETVQKEPSPGVKNYFQNISKASPRALYLSSVSLVEESCKGSLGERFLNLPVKKYYVFGEKSVNWSIRNFLEENSMPYFIVPESGHFMMDDQPALFYGIILEAIRTVKPYKNI